MGLEIDELIVVATATAKAHGFGASALRSVDTHVALIHTEVSEMFEAHRDGQLPEEFWYEHKGRTGPDRLSRSPKHGLDEEFPKPVGIPAELADIVIRACNMAGEHGIDLERAIHEKLKYNGNRPYMHGRHA